MSILHRYATALGIALTATPAAADATMGGTAVYARDGGTVVLMVIDWGYVASDIDTRSAWPIAIALGESETGTAVGASAARSVNGAWEFVHEGCRFTVDPGFSEALVVLSGNCSPYLRFRGSYTVAYAPHR